MKVKKIINGILALLITGSILLFSDLNNRVIKSEKERFTEDSKNLLASIGRTYKIGLTYISRDILLDATINGLCDSLKQLGFVRDSNLIFISQHANGEITNLQPVHLNMDNQDVDLILVATTPGITAAIATVKKHPMVFTLSYTPLEAGAGKSYTDHLPNITGVGSLPPIEKTFDFIKDVIPGVDRVGTVYNSSEPNSVKVMQIARQYCKYQGIELIENSVTSSSDVFQTISALCSRNIDVLWVTGDNTVFQAINSVVKVCRDNKVPLIINDTDFVKYGALAAVGVGWYGTGKHTAPIVARVLNGQSPASIPIENYVEEVISLNHEVAKELNISFPEKYLSKVKSITSKKKYKFCFTHYVDSKNSEEGESGVFDELKRQGLVEGKDYSMKVYNAQGDISTLNSIVERIASDKWDIVFVSSTPTLQSFFKKVKNSPIVFTNVGDPVRAGIGESFIKHPANVTGISTLSDFSGLVKLVIESMPGIKTIGTVYTPGEINSVIYTDELRKAAEKQGLKLISVPANTVTEVSDAARSISSRGVEAITQISDNLTGSCSATIIKEAYNSKIPYFAFVTDQTKGGAVAALARDYYTAGVDAAKMAIKILNGKSPGEIPFEYVKKTMITVNKDAMEYFNVKIPEKYLNQGKDQNLKP